MRVLVTGAGGQVGRALLRAAPEGTELLALDRSQLDLADEQAVRSAIANIKPDLVLNAAAYTAVDKAETEVATAQAINGDALRWLAEAVEVQRGRLVHISTDFVFDGTSSTPYAPDSAPAPLGVYGRSKLAGEQAVATVLGPRGLVVRTSWVYDAAGRNFLNTMLRLMREGKPLRVVADQIGTPTAAHSIACVLWSFVGRPDLAGVWHWSDAGVASWYDFAVAIGEEARSLGILANDASVTPIPTSDYPTPARRPAFSVLDKRTTIEALKLVPAHWRANLRQVMKEIAGA